MQNPVLKFLYGFSIQDRRTVYLFLAEHLHHQFLCRPLMPLKDSSIPYLIPETMADRLHNWWRTFQGTRRVAANYFYRLHCEQQTEHWIELAIPRLPRSQLFR